MKVGIISLGWLGSQLYEKLESSGHAPWGTYHSEPKGLGRETKFDIESDPLPPQALECDWIVFNLPPSTFTKDSFEKLLAQLKGLKLIFVSSTSVYGQSGELDESDAPVPESPNGKLLLECEQLVTGYPGISVVVRPAGLYGKDRHPGRFLSGKVASGNPQAPVNLVSGEDLCELFMTLMRSKSQIPNVLNAVNVHHPSKEEYYSSYCEQHGLALPLFESSSSHGQDKLVSSFHQEFQVASKLP